MNSATIPRRLAVIPLALVLLAAGCGGDDGDNGAGGADVGAVADVERFCELSRQLDQAGEEAFQDVPESAPEQEIRERLGELIEQNQGRLDELARVAPEEIRDDVRTFTEAQSRAVDEGESAFDEEAQQAEQRLQQFEQENCPEAQGGEN